jgi:hypothetical protein
MEHKDGRGGFRPGSGRKKQYSDSNERFNRWYAKNRERVKLKRSERRNDLKRKREEDNKRFEDIKIQV